MTASAEREQLFATQAKHHASPRSTNKSAISNGTRLLPGIDNRSVWVRRCKDIMAQLTSDRGGASECTAAEASVIRRAAVLSVELESLEVKFAKAGQASAPQLDLYGRTAGNLRRLLESLQSNCFSQRRARDITPLSDVLARLEDDLEDREQSITIEAEVVE